MKKIVLMMLVTMVPFLTMAQKRSKKGDKKTVECMMIKGVELKLESDLNNFLQEEFNQINIDEKIRILSESKSVYYITFDFGNENNKEISEMKRSAQKYNSMSAAANAAAENGWEFISANVVNGTVGTTHYYYMKRNK